MLYISRSIPSRAAVRIVSPLRSAGQRRLASSEGNQYNEPTGFLFGERPPPKGQKRVKEEWENVWYWGIGGGMVLWAVGYIYKPDTSIESWAEPAARKNLEASGKPWKYVPSKFSDYHGKEV